MISLSTTFFVCLFLIGSYAEGDPIPGERLLGLEKTVKGKERDRRNLDYSLFFDQLANGNRPEDYADDVFDAMFNPAMMAGMNSAGAAPMGSLSSFGAGSPSFHLDEKEDMGAEDMHMNNLIGVEAAHELLNDHFVPPAYDMMSAMSMGAFPMGMQLGAGWASTMGSASSDRADAEDEAIDAEDFHLSNVFGVEAAHEQLKDHFNPAAYDRMSAMVPPMPGMGAAWEPTFNAQFGTNLWNFDGHYDSMVDDFAPYLMGLGMPGVPRGRRTLRKMPSFPWSEYGCCEGCVRCVHVRMMQYCQRNPFLRACAMMYRRA